MYGNEQTDPLWNEATKRKNINPWLKKLECKPLIWMKNILRFTINTNTGNII